MVCPLTWIFIALLGVGYFLSDKFMAMILIHRQVTGFIWIIGILSILVLALLAICYRKHGKGGDDE
jgi:hypothetical protein